jgi:predicted enzyme related to lactoylglutathione lyase
MAYSRRIHDSVKNSRSMVDFRVRNIDRMATQLRAAGITVEIDPKLYPNGRFARLSDPESNPVELWETQGRDAH